ncbi:putative cell division protein FtsX [Peptoniphilus indolicus ATCC 29427]|uniref:Cell division protein FtsX n=2 Tax=Peptoniphilus indolicus TaxID=33030 RepID=G4D3V5_9FIRM|nr:putative cell division protein FtsX [Peptoniphilus indolicus ATCC 29427]
MTLKMEDIMRIFRQFINILKESLKGIIRNFGMATASTISIGAMLTLFGIVLLLLLNINSAVYNLGQELDKVVVFIRDEAPAADINNLIAKLSKDERVTQVQYISKEKAVEKFKERLGDKAYVMDSLPPDALPASLIVSLNDLTIASEVAREMTGHNIVERADYQYELIEQMYKFENMVKYVGAAIVLALVFVSVLIIHNTIRIAVSNRSHEINIMKYIGATDSYIRSPFLIEGIIFGLVGAALAFFIVHHLYSFYYAGHNAQITNIIEVGLVSPTIIGKHISIIFACIGAGIGYLGSLVSTERHLNV